MAKADLDKLICSLINEDVAKLRVDPKAAIYDALRAQGLSYKDGAIVEIDQKPIEWEPRTGDTFRKKGTTSPTYHLGDKQEDGITFGFIENREVGIAGGEITIFALKNNYELVERPKSIEDVVEKELNKELQTKVEHTSAWSEEDETIISDAEVWLDILCDYLKDNLSAHIPNVRAIISKLESLKDRVQSQPKTEWSQTDNEFADDAITCVTRCYEKYIDNKDFYQSLRHNTLDIKRWLIDVRKRLKPQSQCGSEIPSKEYILNVWELGNQWEEITNGICNTEHGTQLNYIQKHWKEGDYYSKIAPQNRWKPSDDIIMYLERAIEEESRPKNFQMALNNLLEQLKKLKEE